MSNHALSSRLLHRVKDPLLALLTRPYIDRFLPRQYLLLTHFRLIVLDMLALVLFLVVADEVIANVAVVLDERGCAHCGRDLESLFGCRSLGGSERLSLFVGDAVNNKDFLVC